MHCKETVLKSGKKSWYYIADGPHDPSTSKSKNTIRIRSNQIDTLNKGMAKVTVAKINHYMYQQVIYDVAEDVAYNTLDGINDCAGMIFRYAIRNGLLTDNPRTDISLPKKEKLLKKLKKIE